MDREEELAGLRAEIAQLRADNAQLQQILTRALTQAEANQARLEQITARSAVLQQSAAQQSTSSDDLPQDGVTEPGARSTSAPPSPQARPDRQRGGRASHPRQPSQDVADHGPTTDDPPPARRRDFTEEQIKSLVAASKILLEYGRQHRAEHPELYLPIDPATARFER